MCAARFILIRQNWEENSNLARSSWSKPVGYLKAGPLTEAFETLRAGSGLFEANLAAGRLHLDCQDSLISGN